MTVAPTAAANANCPEPSGDAPEPNMKTFPAAPSEDTIDPSKTYIATVNTVRGEFKINLRPDLAPKHVASFVFLANEGYFDGVTFHRVLPGFVAQTGDPTGSGSGGPGYNIPAEFTTAVKYTRGIVGMARSTAPDSAGSQWFVTYGNAPNLDGAYTIFGEVTEGMDVVDCITPRDPSKNPSAPPGDKITSITIEVQ
ncbi:MAG: peptidylprolyl isomerase [Chloroflexota bacterium]